MKRKENWKQIQNLFALLGMHSAQKENNITPFAFLLHSEEPYSVKSIQERLAQFGIMTEIDESERMIALPCHVELEKGQIDYIFGAFRGMINPCHTFVRNDPAKE